MNKDEINEAQAKYIQKMFGQPCYSKSQQSVRIVNMLGEKPKCQPSNPAMYFFAAQNMTVKQLIEKWYKIQFKNKQNTKRPQDYVLIYKKDQQDYGLYDNQTIDDFKNRLQHEIIFEELTLFAYEDEFSPFQNQSAMTDNTIQEFEKKHKKSIEIPIKAIIDSKAQRAYYFYLDEISTKNKINPDINIKKLHQLIQQELKSKTHPLKCQNDIKYRLWIEKQTISQILVQTLKYKNIPIQTVWNNNKLTIDPQMFDFQLRQLCSPSQIVTLEFTTPCFKYESVPAAQDCLIRITCYERNGKEQNQNIDKPIKLSLKKRIIEKNYSQISKMKISTFLKEQKVQDPLLMSIYLDGQIIKPSVRFEEIQKIQKYINSKKPADFICVTDNFLFYQEMNELSNKTTIQELLRQLPKNKHLPVKIYEQSNKQFTTQRDSRLKQTKNIRQQHRTLDFIDPIMVYTTDMICYKMNSFLRETSIALFDQQKIRHQYWPYIASKKLIQSLSKLQNYIGTVYRGAGQIKYDCKVGDTLEWGCFSSTSKQLNIAKNFFKFKSHPYIFQIMTFTGKQIGKFSICKTQHEVLLLPYTRFKVLQVEQKINHTYVKMLEIPVPKKIPGNIVVWIDPNFRQNAMYYNMMVKDYDLKDFDLIQLESTEHFMIWLNEYKYILNLPHVKVHFITNMNRPTKVPKNVPEGIQTLNIIRSFSQTTKVIFFIGNVYLKRKELREAGKGNDAHIEVMDDPGLLMKYLHENRLKM